MALLNKFKGSTLIENLISIIILISVFLLATSILQYYSLKITSENSRSIKVEFDQKFYLYNNNKIHLPDQHSNKDWMLKYSLETQEKSTFFKLKATNEITLKELNFEHVLDK